MKNVSPELLALLATRQFWKAYLYTFTLITGTVMRYTDADYDIVSGGNRFSSSGVQFQLPSATWKTGLEVQTMTLTVLPKATDGVLGVPFLAAIDAGLFDGAEVTIELAFMPALADVSAGTVIVHAGRVGSCQAGRSKATLPINSHLEILANAWPATTITPGCVLTLYSAPCGVAKAAFRVAGVAAAGSTQALLATNLAAADGYFDLGQVIFTAGANNGLARPVKRQLGGAVALGIPFPFAPAAGDTFDAYPGCDRSKEGANGCAKFANQARFKGFRFVPVPDTAV